MSDASTSDLLARFRHSHDHGAAAESHEKRTRWVVALTLAMMVTELIVGYASNSLALTADGWHMATHAGALGMAAFAYWFGGPVIARWSYGLCRQAAKQLLDVVPSMALAQRIRERIESTFAGSRVVDLHLWDLGPGARACIASVAAASPQAPAAYRVALESLVSLEHLTIEVHPPGRGDAEVAS